MSPRPFSMQVISAALGVIAVVLITAVISGCQRGDPLDARVEASTTGAFQQWRARVADDLTHDQLGLVDQSVQELKLNAMANGVTGSDAIDDDFRRRVDGKPVRDLLALGFGAKLARLQQQRDAIDAFLQQNSQLQTKPGDTASADYLKGKREEQLTQRDSVDREISATRDQFKGAGITNPIIAKLPPLNSGGPPTTAAGASSAASSDTSDSAPVLQHK